MSLLLYGYTPWTLTKCLEIKLNGIYSRRCCGVMVIVLGNGHGDPSSNPRQSCLH